MNLMHLFRVLRRLILAMQDLTAQNNGLLADTQERVANLQRASSDISNGKVLISDILRSRLI